MHINNFFSFGNSNTSSCIPGMCAFSGIPLPLGKKLEFVVVNNCREALSKRNQFHIEQI